MTWKQGTMRKDLLGIPENAVIAFRQSSLKLKLGTTWWVVYRNKPIQVAEAFGGKSLCRLVKPLRCKGLVIGSGPLTTEKLNSVVAKFEFKSEFKKESRD